jgi:hypothetical protein
LETIACPDYDLPQRFSPLPQAAKHASHEPAKRSANIDLS